MSQADQVWGTEHLDFGDSFLRKKKKEKKRITNLPKRTFTEEGPMQVRSLMLKVFHRHGNPAFGDGTQSPQETVGKLRLGEQMPLAQHCHSQRVAS